jgi:hypothetical protein
MKRLSFNIRLQVVVLALICALCAGAASAAEWKFGVMSDTQWTGSPDDGHNPNTCAVDIVNQLNRQFIDQKVKFVVQVGDLCDSTNNPVGGAYYNAPEDTRATFAQALYNAGIGFYTLRGNHDSDKHAAGEFVRIYPQTQNGRNNMTPKDAMVVTADYGPAPAVTRGSFIIGANFSSPDPKMAGLTYSFDYNNARFVFLDQFGAPDGTAFTIDAQQPWITSTLSGRPERTHAFVFSHKGLITENHVDNLFGANPAADPTGTDAFIRSMAYSDAHYLILGHDHMHDRSIVRTSMGLIDPAHVTQLVCASDSSKFYIPSIPTNDQKYDVPAGFLNRQTEISQELNTVGYYIFTVDDDRVKVDYYSAVVNPTLVSGEYLIAATPHMTFSLRETFGYSLSGKEFTVAQGESYTKVQDSFAGTTAAILSGVNGATNQDASLRQFTKLVTTGWDGFDATAGSYTFTILGMASTMGNSQTDTYTLSMTYDHQITKALSMPQSFGIATKDANGHWIAAVDKNTGGAKLFVNGPWNPAYGLGSYGIDPDTKTAWAVLNYNGDFTVADFSGAH